MKREPRAFLWDIVQACNALQQFLSGVAFSEYLVDLQLKSAVERQLITVGEALTQLSRLDPAGAARIPEYRQVIAFRNVLVQGYASLRDDEVWRAIDQNLPQLLAAAEKMLAESDDTAGQ
jgi:uncharacterized protein with HEPN domain